jgi:hypothetical protein
MGRAAGRAGAVSRGGRPPNDWPVGPTRSFGPRAAGARRQGLVRAGQD